MFCRVVLALGLHCIGQLLHTCWLMRAVSRPWTMWSMVKVVGCDDQTEMSHGAHTYLLKSCLIDLMVVLAGRLPTKMVRASFSASSSGVSCYTGRVRVERLQGWFYECHRTRVSRQHVTWMKRQACVSAQVYLARKMSANRSCPR